MKTIILEHKSLRDMVVATESEMDERIDQVNQELQEYVNQLLEEHPILNGKWENLLEKYEFSGRNVKMRNTLISVVLSQMINFLKGGDMVEEYILAFVKTIMENTDIDDTVYDIVADKVKETIPGEEYEPIIGKIFVGIGTRLQD